jgi:putative nucleotidyltransferase with HDIG domain
MEKDRDKDLTYIPIFLETILINSVIGFDLYMYNRERGNYVLFSSRSHRFTDVKRADLIAHRTHVLFITGSDVKAYNTYIENNLDQIIENPLLKKEEKANIVYQTARNVMESVMTNPEAGESITRSEKFVSNTIRYILTEKDYFFDIIRLTSHDYYTYTHSVNVCIYSLALARRIGTHSPFQLSLIGAGALLHDIGKSVIPKEILLKKEKLTDEEWQTIQTHSARGVDLLKTHKDIHSEILSIVHFHHEKLDGSGYPCGLKDADISENVRITTIADIFDAINTNRPYKSGVDTFHTLEIMNEQFSGKIDRSLLKEFIQLFRK